MFVRLTPDDNEEVSEDWDVHDVMQSNALTSEVTHVYLNNEEESEDAFQERMQVYNSLMLGFRSVLELVYFIINNDYIHDYKFA